MATKIYKLNSNMNSATFPLYANNGKMKVDYTFKDGNQLMRQPARCTLHDKFYQDLLEGSDLFKRGVIAIERTLDAEKPAAPAKKRLRNIEGVTTAKEAIDFVLNTWAVKVTSARQAKDFANKQGYDFPNL